MIFVDTKTQSDSARTLAAIELLHELSTGHQVTVFAQEDEVDEWTQDCFDPDRDEIIALCAPWIGRRYGLGRCRCVCQNLAQMVRWSVGRASACEGRAAANSRRSTRLRMLTSDDFRTGGHTSGVRRSSCWLPAKPDASATLLKGRQLAAATDDASPP